VIKKRDSFLFFRPLEPKQLKNSIIKLGASFIKLAQVLATRADFFSQEYLDELKELHDDIPPMSKAHFDKVYNSAFPQDIFKEFSTAPLASASIGQVHIAYLYDGRKVAVKLRRHGIESVVRADIHILKTFNRLFKPLFSKYTKHSIESLVVEFSDMILKEVSLNQEMQNLKEFRHRYEHIEISTPIPIEEYCSDEAIVMSFMEGVRFDDKEGLLSLGVSFESIIEKLVLAYVEQMLIGGFFHADPHPGNLLVDKDGNLILLDFGMVKKIDNRTRIAVIELVKSANERDFETFIYACKKLGVVAEESPIEEMQSFAESMFDVFNNDSLDSASMQKLAFDVLGSMKDFPFKLPQEAIYILRVSAIIEGLGTTYIENFNGVKDILPILQKNMTRALGANDGLLSMFVDELTSFPLTMKKVQNIINKAENGSLEIRLQKGYEERMFDGYKKIEKEKIIFFSMTFLSFLVLFYDKSYISLSVFIFLIGFFRVLYKM